MHCLWHVLVFMSLTQRLLIYFRIQIHHSFTSFVYSVLFEFFNRFTPHAMEEDFPIHLSWYTEMYKA